MRRTFLLLAALTLGTACVSTTPTPEEILETTGIAIDHYPGRAPALVFLHGWTCTRVHWQEQVRHFENDYEMVTIDLAGHGESTVDKDVWTVPALADEVAEVIVALDLDEVILIGHSMGGSVALAVPPEVPGRVIGIVGVDCLHNAEFEFPQERVDAVIARFEADFPAAMDRFIDGFFASRPEADETKALVKATMGNVRPEVAIPLFRSSLGLDVAQALRGAGVPIRCINAATPFATEIEINRQYADFDAVLMENVTHFPMLERPGEFNVILGKTIEELSSSP